MHRSRNTFGSREQPGKTTEASTPMTSNSCRRIRFWRTSGNTIQSMALGLGTWGSGLGGTVYSDTITKAFSGNPTLVSEYTVPAIPPLFRRLRLPLHVPLHRLVDQHMIHFQRFTQRLI